MNLGVCSSKLLKGASLKIDEFQSSERPAEKADEHAVEGAKNIKPAVSAKAEEIRTAAQTKAETLGKQLEEYVRGDPIKAILIVAGMGLGAGFVVGLLVRR